MKNVVAIILAAGEGTRIRSKDGRNKVVYSLDNKPMIAYAVDTLKKAGVDKVIAVVGYAHESVKEALGKKVTYAVQEKRLGTGHAVKQGLSKVPSKTELVLSMYGDDSAFYPVDLVRKMVSHHKKAKAFVTLLTIMKKNPTGLGRIIRDSENEIVAIVEEKNATGEQKEIGEINTGLYCFDHKFLRDNIDKIKRNKISGEYYLTDIVEIAKTQGLKVEALTWDDNSVWFGVNTIEQLEQAKKLMNKRKE